MASRRMISTEIYTDDKFTDLEPPARLLFTYLVLAADDDGFFAATKQAVFLSGATTEDLQRLVDAGYLYKFDGGVYVIRHWKQMNTIQKDRYKPTVHVNELASLTEQNKVYELNCIQNGNGMDTQNSLNQNQSSLGQYSTDKVSLDEHSIGKGNSDDTDGKIATLMKDKTYKTVLDYYREKIGNLRSLDEFFHLHELLEYYSVDEVMAGIEFMATKEGKSVNYLDKILETNNLEE